jgi:tripartite-type tricarboxylate transporter receptor subunit TctC
MRTFVRLAGSSIALLSAVAGGHVAAQSFPSKPIRIVVPFPAGGASDFAGRLVSQRLPELLGQQVVIDNRPGAAGTVGAEIVAKAPPDGHTLLIGNIGVLSVAPSLFSKLSYQPLKDFLPVTNVVAGPNFIVAHPALPTRTVKDLIALAKARPGELNFASAGPGQVSHIGGELFKMMAGVNITFIFYRGQASYMAELVGGVVPLAVSTVPEMLPLVQAKKLRAVAVTSLKRTPVAADVPTVDESGLPGFEVVNWNGLVVPAGTPPDVISRLNRDIVKVLQIPELRSRVEALGNYVIGDTSAEFGAYIRSETEKWARVIKQAGIKLDP